MEANRNSLNRMPNGTPVNALPAAELAMLTYIALVAASHDCPRLLVEAWSDNGAPYEDGKRLHGVSIFGAPQPLLHQLQDAITAAPGSWRIVLRPQQDGAYVYDSA